MQKLQGPAHRRDGVYFNPRIWRPIAIVLSLFNLGGLVLALGAGEPGHAMGHVILGVGLAVWARRLGASARDSIGDSIGGSERHAQLEGLENEVDQLRRELTETQERLDFAERMLAQRR
jgi:hypothetical protein